MVPTREEVTEASATAAPLPERAADMTMAEEVKGGHALDRSIVEV